MATLLEQGIIATRKGQKAEAKVLFKQVLQADRQNDRAWLWLSEVADTLEERIACVERAIAINPTNEPAKVALQKLKAQTNQPLLAMPVGSSFNDQTIATPVQSDIRKPFRLSEHPAGLANHQEIHNQPTFGMPPAAYVDQNTATIVTHSAQTNGVAVSNGHQVNENATKEESFPLIPVLIFGSLGVTALGGLSMFILLNLLT